MPVLLPSRGVGDRAVRRERKTAFIGFMVSYLWLIVLSVTLLVVRVWASAPEKTGRHRLGRKGRLSCQD